MERWKRVTEKAYRNHAQEYMAGTMDYWERFPGAKRMMERFLELLPGRLILDIGSGGGRDSIIFREQGFRSIAVDISVEMLSIARKQDLETALMDFQHLGFRDSSADGIWAYASLLHLPHDQFAPVIREFHRILHRSGVLLISMLEGEGEEYRESSERWAGDVRYFAFWQENELRDILTEAGFKVVATNRPQGNFIDILALKTG